jgi:hypothetical protein
MLNVVFQRMEADSMNVTVKPIAVADMLAVQSRGGGGGAGGPGVLPDSAGVAVAVQGFLNNVISVTGWVEGGLGLGLGLWVLSAQRGAPRAGHYPPPAR